MFQLSKICTQRYIHIFWVSKEFRGKIFVNFMTTVNCIISSYQFIHGNLKHNLYFKVSVTLYYFNVNILTLWDVLKIFCVCFFFFNLLLIVDYLCLYLKIWWVIVQLFFLVNCQQKLFTNHTTFFGIHDCTYAFRKSLCWRNVQ